MTELSAAGQGREAASPFLDEGARRLWEAAAAERQALEDGLLRYVAVVKERVGIGLRMPLKDRTLFRSEAASRVFWSREGGTVVQVLGVREQTPAGLEDADRPGFVDGGFDPLNDRLFFGMGPVEDAEEANSDDFWFEHPLDPQWAEGYRFSSGDTLTLSLPDGRRLQAVELEVVPTRADVHRMMGSLWIEPESGSLVRAVYRLSDVFDAFRDIPDLREEEDEDLRHVPELFKPWTVELAVVAVEYGWWEGDVWLPRTLRAEGTAQLGFLSVPATMEVSYQVESVLTQADTAREAAYPAAEEHHFRTRSEALAFLAQRLGEDVPYALDPSTTRVDDPRGRRTVRYLLPEDRAYLRSSPHLPPPVWEEAPAFPDAEEVAQWEETLRDLPTPQAGATPWTFRWGAQRTDLLRYNRVEGLSVGARAQIRPATFLGPLSVTATARAATLGQTLTGRLDVTRETLARRVTLSGFHELAAVDESARHLGPGNSAVALLFGRDDGDYYRRTGAALTWTPPSGRRQSFELRAYAERHRPVSVGTDFALWQLPDDAFAFRDNLQAAPGWEAGGELVLRPWWGTDPRLAQGGLDLRLRGAGGEWSYARASLEGRLAVPLPASLRLGLEGGGGTSWGDPPPQRRFLLGGPLSLRGHPARAREGTTYGRVRAELARHFSFGSVALFGDGGWAGDERAWPDSERILWSVGTGLSLVDGLIRLDGAWGLRAPRDFRLDLYLDGIL